VLEESLQHWRHIENLRQGFTSVWAVIVAGVLAFVSQTPKFLENGATILALIFLILLTVLGLLMSVRLSYNIKPCEDNIEEILRNAGLEKYSLIKGWEKGFTRHFRLRRVFSLTCFVALVFLTILLILTVSSFLKSIEKGAQVFLINLGVSQ
jgi:hypothetical protein